MIAIRRVELAGFVDDLFGDRDLADVMQERSEFEVSALIGGELSSSATASASATTLLQ